MPIAPVSMTTPAESLIAQIAALLANVAPTKMGAEFLANNDSPPRFVWIPVSDEFIGETDIQTNVDFGPSPTMDFEVYGSFDQTFAVHIWGATYAIATRMRAALITAIQRITTGAYQIGNAEWFNGGPQAATKGWVCLQTVSLTTPLVEQALPATAGAAISDTDSPTAQATTEVVRVPTFHIDDE